MGVIETLFWDMAVYESYVAICKNNPAHPFATLLFGNLMAFNYIQTQAIKIRRLCEPSPSKTKNKDTSVYSLHRVVDDIKEARKSGAITRDSLHKVYGIPKIRETNITHDNYVTEAVNGSTYVVVDYICDKNGLLKKPFIRELDKRLLIDKNVELSEIIQFVNKNLVHSASDASRQQLGQELVLRITDMKKVIQGITELYFCCTMFITRSGDGSVIPMGWDNQLTNLDKHEISIVNDVFKKVESDCQNWKSNGFSLLGL